MDKKELIFKKIPEIIYRLAVLAFLAGCILKSEGITRVLLAVIGSGAVIISALEYFLPAAVKSMKRIRLLRLVWIGAYALAFIAASLYYNEIHLPDELPVRRVSNQHIYQAQDEKEGRIPDAALREIIRNKTVYLPYEVRPYSYYNPIEDEEERGAGFVADYYIENNYTRYFQEYAGKAVYDENLPKKESVPGFMGEKAPEGFTDLGIANDMLRYTFMLNKENSKETRYFWYSWYYYSFADEENHFPRIYVDKDSCEGSDELVAIWDGDENLYLMGLLDYEKRSDISA